MINWNTITYDDIILLATIAASYNMGISDMLCHLDQLTEEQREVVDHLLQKHAEKADRTDARHVVIDKESH